METDKIPKRVQCKAEEYRRSDGMCEMDLPPAEPLTPLSRLLEEALSRQDCAAVQLICNALAAGVAAAYEVPPPPVKVLGVRPRHVTETSVSEKFGDYDPNTTQIRLWMRTAVKQRATSFGTLLSTLCHEICHHLDMVSLDLPNSYHTRGFYERAARLYHHVRGTPLRKLIWTEQSDGTYRINWGQTMKNRAQNGLPELRR